MKTFLSLLLCLGLALTGYAQGVSDSAKDEIMRRGYMIEVCDPDTSIGADALELPPDDSHKFTLCIVYGAYRNAACDALKLDLLKNSGRLGAWVKTRDLRRGTYDLQSTDDSFLHCTWEQSTTPFKTKWNHIKQFPTLVLLAPRTGQYGENDPNSTGTTVINQRTGYDSNPDKLAAWVEESLKKYMLAMQKRGGHEQRYPAPFPIQPKVLPDGPEPSPIPDLVPTEPKPLTPKQIRQLCPEADSEFVYAQLEAEVTDPQVVVAAWSAKLAKDALAKAEQDRQGLLDKVTQRLAEVEQSQTQTTAGLLDKVVERVDGSLRAQFISILISLFILAAPLFLKWFTGYAATTPTPVDDIVAKVLERAIPKIIERLEKRNEQV